MRPHRIIFGTASRLALLWIAVSGSTTSAAEPLAGKPFEGALDKKVGVSWGGQIGNTLRDIVRQLTASQNVSILVDRRVDPTQLIELTVPPTPLREVLAALAHAAESESLLVSNVVYVGPVDAVKKLRTLIELRNNDLSKLTSNAAPPKSPWRNRSVLLTKRVTFAWQDFDRPRDILKQVADKFQFEIDGLDKLPHDLWASASLPQMTATEALTLLLVQFDSTFEFLPDRAAVRIVPIPKDVSVERIHAIPANSTATIENAREQFPDVEIKRDGAKFIVRGTVEQHAEFAEWLKPGGPKPAKLPANKPTKKLADRRFTLKQSNVALGDVIKTFTEYGVRISYDAQKLADADISLDKKIDINANEASAEKLFRELFEPHGVEVSIEGDTVRLRPKAK